MTPPLLTTKLYIPSPRPNFVPRSRLIQQLEAGRWLGGKLTLIAAPAGFGKTTLVSSWIYDFAALRPFGMRPFGGLTICRQRQRARKKS